MLFCALVLGMGSYYWVLPQAIWGKDLDQGLYGMPLAKGDKVDPRVLELAKRLKLQRLIAAPDCAQCALKQSMFVDFLKTPSAKKALIFVPNRESAQPVIEAGIKDYVLDATSMLPYGCYVVGPLSIEFDQNGVIIGVTSLILEGETK